MKWYDTTINKNTTSTLNKNSDIILPQKNFKKRFIYKALE